MTDVLRGMQSAQTKVAALLMQRWEKGKHGGALKKHGFAPGA